MTCEECLALVATEPATSLARSGVAWEHAANCADCARVLALVTDAENDLAHTLNAAQSHALASRTADDAMTRVRRRQVGRWASVALAILFAIALWSAWDRALGPDLQKIEQLSGGNLRTEPFELHCLTPEQAGDIISPYVRSNGSAYYPTKMPIRLITVRATPEELIRVRTLLARMDAAGEGVACASGKP